MAVFILYFIPFAMDIVVSQLLFVGRHSLASQGASEAVVGSIPLLFGAGYFLSGPLMRIIIRPKFSKIQMLVAIAMITGLSLFMAQTRIVSNFQILFFLLPISVSFFFNAFQSFMLRVSKDLARPLHITVSLFTFAWSMGFGLGPLVSGITAGYFSWSENYYLAALFSVLIAVIVVTFRPSKRPDGSRNLDTEVNKTRQDPQLHIPGWMGVVIGLIGWYTIATYWPIIAAQQGISPAARGLVEFSFAMAQGFGALALILLGTWQHKIYTLPIFGLFGVVALLVFGASSGMTLYIAGASLMGLFTGGTFLFSVYHSMLDSERASKRVAMNEMMVGLGFLIGPVLAAILHQDGQPFMHAFSMTAILIGALVSAQTWIAYRISHQVVEKT